MLEVVRVERRDEAFEEELDALLGEAWAESGRRRGQMPEGWRPYDPALVEGFALRGRRGALLGWIAVRPMEGMDSIDFCYLLPEARAAGGLRALVEPAVERLKEIGRTRIIYLGYGWWRGAFPDGLRRGFAAAGGFGCFEGVFLVRPIEAGGAAAPAPVAPGYIVTPWRDEDYDEVCEVMLASPEPEALYWDMGLCRRSILNAGAPSRPLFPDGLGQLARERATGRIAAFSLSTTYGYVNHVYTHPDHRRRGLGAAVLTRLLGALGRKGIERATILTHETNPRAIALYERLGFAVDFRYPQFWLKW